MTTFSPYEVVVTGMGLVSPLGLTTSEHLAAAKSRRTGIGRGHLPGTDTGSEIPMGVCAPFDLSDSLRCPKNSKYFSRSVSLAVKAARDAAAQSRILEVGFDPWRIGVYTGSGQTGLEFTYFSRALSVAWQGQREHDFKHLGGRPSRLIDPNFSLRTLSNGAIAMLCVELGAKGPSVNFVHSDPASAIALQTACFDLVEDRCDVAMAGGYDTLLYPSVVHAYHNLGVLSQSDAPEPLAPFDQCRDGLVPSEGAAFFVLEKRTSAEARGASVLADILAIETTTTYDEQPLQPRMSDRLVPLVCEIKDRYGSPEFLVGQGLGTRADDAKELHLLARCARDMPVTAFKGYTGYVGAATAALELGFGLGCASNGFVPAVAGLKELEPCEVNVIKEEHTLARGAGTGLFVSCGWSGQLSAILAASRSS